MTGNQVIVVPEAKGWSLDRINGSHHVMTKPGLRSIPVPVHGNADLGFFAKKILREAGIE